jgi:hypothetical protein
LQQVSPLGQQTSPQQVVSSGQQAPLPQSTQHSPSWPQIWPGGQQVSPQQSCSGGQQTSPAPPQQVWLAGQQLSSSQMTTVSKKTHSLPQQTSAPVQQVLPQARGSLMETQVGPRRSSQQISFA